MKVTFESCTYEILEDLPEVGFYLYKYNQDGKCDYDTLQNTFETCVDVAYEEFNVPKSLWEK